MVTFIEKLQNNFQRKFIHQHFFKRELFESRSSGTLSKKNVKQKWKSRKTLFRITLGDHLSLLAMYDKCGYYIRIQIYISAIYI